MGKTYVKRRAIFVRDEEDRETNETRIEKESARDREKGGKGERERERENVCMCVCERTRASTAEHRRENVRWSER